MENKKSLLKLDKVDIAPKIHIRIPTVDEILDDEQSYFSLISSLTATPFQYMVQLDDIGIDYETITDYELFLMLFPSFAQGDISILFGDIDLSDILVRKSNQNNTDVLYSQKNDIIIDELIYTQIVDCIRKINNLKRDNRTSGNKEAKDFRIKLERKKQKRNAKKPYEPYLENLVVALVNNDDFPYDYDSCMDLSIYRFNQSFQQIMHKTNFDKTMIGVYAGTIDTSKIKDRSCLTWIPIKQ